MTPFALTEQSGNAIRVTAANRAAEKAGVYSGISLTDARALCPGLQSENARPEEDAETLTSLAFWCLRFSPIVTVHPPDSLALDITGCAHLFGGEKAMIREISARLSGFHLSHRLALADTLGGAWAYAHYGKENIFIIEQDQLLPALSPLPLEALRLTPGMVSNLKQLGLRKIGHMIHAPKAPLTSRFGRDLVGRLDQALGKAAETFNPLVLPADYITRHPFHEPAVHLGAIEAALAILSQQMQQQLKDAHKGARELNLQIFRVDGFSQDITIRTSRLCQEASHMQLLLQEKLDHFYQDLDLGFGIELITLSARDIEQMEEEQKNLSSDGSDTPLSAAPTTQELDRLLDRFSNRFGPQAVTRFEPHSSHIPERSFKKVPLTVPKKSPPWAESQPARRDRPFLFFTPPEPITVMAEVPDGPPLRFEWRRLQHLITRAEGPERLAPEWWLCDQPNISRQTRDYYRVENSNGQRFWLYRDGLYDRDQDAPRWFMQGLFP